MKTEDFERLKAVCEKEGFGIQHFHTEETYHIWKKDQWEGVEFVDRLTNDWPICKINSIEKDRVFYYDSEGKLCSWGKGGLRPSTEQAYVEQLKKTAFEKFGEIKKGDRFIEPSGNIDTPSFNIKEWDYFKEDDQLFFYNLVIYKQGKWAERVKERVKVELKSAEIYHSTQFPMLEFEFNSSFKVEKSKSNELGKFLASQLEKYLNGEIE